MRTTARVQRQTPRGFQTPLPDLTSHGSLPGLVAIARGQTPDPIPNSAVKTLSAHGTAATSGGRVGRRQARQAPNSLLPVIPPPARNRRRLGLIVAGWSSPVARQAHNLKVVGSNPTPATTERDLASRIVAGVSRRARPVHA